MNSQMDTDEQSVVLPSILGALLGTQNGREVEIVNTFELATEEGRDDLVDHDFLMSRRDQWYCSTPLLLVLQPSTISSSDITGQTLPFKAYEPTIEIRDKKTRSVFIEAPYKVETGEAERIAVDWTAKGGGGSTSLESHLQSQRAAVKMLHERILVLVQYVTNVIAGQIPTDHTTLRSLSALIASLPASENKGFRDEFNTEYEDVQLTAFLSSLTKSTNILNDLVDKHLVLTGGSRDDRTLTVRRRGMGRQGMMPGDWGMHP
ncbi:maintenance of mitochondrial structure and function-domain-containing protein [Suillus subaureus]|uniref:COP9 signalosome complex subunit 6 n=1 Tax=Suillus subaureus TaxID=48587 RepID=A0A9P7ENV4_9AGAM|nr:maintenance of mitochondrial structure and function-domain-containing protein [Suillus subaureus]KAG1826194.1 maintenance of mitochondrial structure and function-domain-containing protein [Suillus subaureus]